LVEGTPGWQACGQGVECLRCAWDVWRTGREFVDFTPCRLDT
jgi:hypothetical protein